MTLVEQLRAPVSASMFVRKSDMLHTLFQERRESAELIDAMTEALVEAREQIAILQDRLGIKDTGHGTLSIIDAALRLQEKSNA